MEVRILNINISIECTIFFISFIIILLCILDDRYSISKSILQYIIIAFDILLCIYLLTDSFVFTIIISEGIAFITFIISSLILKKRKKRWVNFCEYRFRYSLFLPFDKLNKYNYILYLWIYKNKGGYNYGIIYNWCS